MQYLEGIASGDLEGTGSWTFKETAGITEVHCNWHVATNIGWMNAFAFLLKPLFRYNHGLVMKNGAMALAKRLDAPLIEVTLS